MDLLPLQWIGEGALVRVLSRGITREAYCLFLGSPAVMSIEKVEFRSDTAWLLRFRLFAQRYGAPILKEKLNVHFWAAFVAREMSIGYDAAWQRFVRRFGTAKEVVPMSMLAQEVLQTIINVTSAARLDQVPQLVTARSLNGIIDALKLMTMESGSTVKTSSMLLSVRKWRSREDVT